MRLTYDQKWAVFALTLSALALGYFVAVGFWAAVGIVIFWSLLIVIGWNPSGS